MRTQNKILSALLLSWVVPPIIYGLLEWHQRGQGQLAVFLYTGFLVYIMHQVGQLRNPE